MKSHFGIKTILLKVSRTTQSVLQTLLEGYLQARQILVDPGLTVYQLPDGTIVELYGSGASYPPFLFQHSDIVIGYRVGNLTQAMQMLLKTGARQLSEVVTITSRNCYCFMLLNGTQVIGLYQLS
ncbi:hypothetical protein [Chitinophaga sp. CF418]|uniref:hypothetical protein n=1 Tax=Chitinophaga sp. CF418 TaxID=1855287 RepID=UPI000919157E|nr:hypothetical protein [Chitinophaga sp. CF418]SHL94153.1 hypothetical protein SAMN05216311_101185 [Chitinophaga sp. CF418]